jgi:hypothetical protein
MTTLAEDCAALSDEQCKEIDRVRLDMVEAITQAMQTALKQIPEDGSAFERVAAHMIACTASMVTCRFRPAPESCGTFESCVSRQFRQAPTKGFALRLHAF